MPGSSDPAHFTLLGSRVLFAADNGLIGREPWITDGTAAGTRLLLEINPRLAGPGGQAQPLGSDPGPFVRLGNRAYFAADDGVSGRELWSTNGTAAGTVRVRDLRPGAASSNPRDLVTAETRLYFLADGGASDALWTVSPAGQATRVRLLQEGRRAWGLAAAGSHLFFVVDSAATGPELWTSDGTRPGTRLVREIRPGALGSYPQELTAVNNLLLFAADDGLHGLEPWVTDGTAAGTRLLADLAPGTDASGPANFSVAGDLVGFDADDGVHGREMWAVRKGDLNP
jgi:ELWxxDGT repeat protein